MKTIREKILDIIGCQNKVNCQHTMEAQRPCSFCIKKVDQIEKLIEEDREKCLKTTDGRHLWKGKLFENWTRQNGHELICKACEMFSSTKEVNKLNK